MDRLAQVAAATMLLATLIAGCGDSGSSVRLIDEPGADMTRNAGQYWMAWVEGEEGPKESRAVCSIAFDHEIDADAKAIRFNGDSYQWAPSSVEVLIVYDIWDRGSGCPEAVSLHNDWRGYEETRRWGNADASVGSDGSVTFAGTRIVVGQVATFRAEHGGAESVIRVHAYGAWPQSGLHAE